MVHNKYIHIGVFWTSADPPPRRLSSPLALSTLSG